MNKYAIIVAGGKGQRMGSDIPKQFLQLAGRPVLMYTLEAFKAYEPDINLLLVLPEHQQAYWKRLCDEHDFTMDCLLATGGQTRFHSVSNGLALIPDTNALVAVHDGVRPLVSTVVIERAFMLAALHGAAIPVMPVVESLRLLKDEASCSVNRSSYRLVQTPQVFRLSLLRRAYEQAYQADFTDDASVVEALGHKISLVEGNRENIKLTMPEDLLWAEAFMLHQQKNQS